MSVRRKKGKRPREEGEVAEEAGEFEEKGEKDYNKKGTTKVLNVDAPTKIFPPLPAVVAADRIGIGIPSGAFDAGSLLSFKKMMLPSVVISSALDWVAVADLCVLQTTSKSNYRVLRHDDIWRDAIKKHVVITPAISALITQNGYRWERLARELGRVLAMVSTNCLYGLPVPRVLRNIWFEIIVHHKGSYAPPDEDYEISEEGNARSVFGVENVNFWSTNKFKTNENWVNEATQDDEEGDTAAFVQTLKPRVAWIGFIWMTEESRPFGYWLEKSKRSGFILRWQIYQGPVHLFDCDMNLSSFITNENEDTKSWFTEHGGLEKLEERSERSPCVIP